MTQALAGALLFLFPFHVALAQGAPGKNASPQTSATTNAQASAGSVTPQAPAAAAPQSPTTGAVEPATAQGATAPNYSQEAYVIEHMSESQRFEDDGKGRYQADAEIKIISESGVQTWGQLKVGYSALTEKLDIAYVRVHKPDGTVVTAQESAIQDLSFADAPVYTDYRQKHISVPSLRPGDVLEYRFIRTIASPLTPGQFWSSYNFREKEIVLDEQLEINVPKDRQVKLKTKPGYEPKVTEEGDRRIYRWTHSRLSNDDDNKKKKARPKSEDEIPTVQLTTFRSWEEVGAWYGSLERERRVPDATVKTEAETLVKGKTGDMDKVKALYDYVSRNIRYVSLNFGLGRIQPHAASEVLANGYGDCKDKNTLLAALLETQGFHSTSVLIGARLKLDPEIPSPSQFNHLITRVPVDGKEIWLDSTPGVAPFRMLSSNLRGKQALAIPPNGNAELVWTPTDLPFDAFERTALEGSISDTGTLTAHFTMIERGDHEMVMRYIMRQQPSNRWKEYFQQMLQYTAVKRAEVSDVKISDPSSTDEPLHIEFNVTANNYFDWSAPDSKFALPMVLINVPAVDDNDDSASTEPIKLISIQEVQGEVKLSFPAKYSVHPPIAVDVKRDYAEYHSLYKYEAGQLTGKRTLKVLMIEVPHDRSEDYIAFRRVVLADQSQEVKLENQSPSSAGVSSSESAEDLNSAGEKAAANGKYQLAIDLFQQVVKLEPKHKTAWNNLGRAYLDVGQTDKAIQAIQTEIAINPYSQYAYNNLGLAYEKQSRYDEAAKQFQKQIEINPLDAEAHADLGRLYLDQKKFAEAIPELEKAVDLQSRNPVLKISLGQAYIATNQTDKGMAAFDEAIKISASPLIWNNIAYALAEENVQLDRASQYADAAINAIETQLRDINLDNLRMQDLFASNFLFNIWDTKGRIEFRRGDLEAADAYIRPAWLAGGYGDEAEHLGEISEKRGQRAEAVRQYIDALVSENPSATDARARLTALGVKDIERRTTAARAELQQQRTVALNKSGKGRAEFYLLVSPGKIEQVKFIKGDDELKTFADVLQKTDIGMKFPPNPQVHVIRRVVVQCGTTSPGPCTLEVLPASQVRVLE